MPTSPKPRSSQKLRTPLYVRQRYCDLSGNSGVLYFQIGLDFIRLWFKSGGGCYEYDWKKPGKHHVEEMKRRAVAGRGLATYVNQHVKGNYARILPP